MTEWQPGGHFPFLRLPNQNFAASSQTHLPAPSFSRLDSHCTAPHPLGALSLHPSVFLSSHPPPFPLTHLLSPPSALPRPAPAERQPAARAPRCGPGLRGMRSAAPPPSPTRPAAELCQECEEPARASVGHGEPPPPPPPPRARLSPEQGSELSPHQRRAWLLRRRGMTDPLTRTLSRLRGRQGPRAAGGPRRRAAAAATVAASSAAEGDAGGAPGGSLRERASGARPSLERPPPSPQAWGPEARVPGGRPERSGALGPRPRSGKEAAPPGRGLTRASLHAPPGSEGSGEDEEDDADYYENLPGGSQPAPEPEGAEAERWPPPPPAAGSSPGVEGGRLETGRLQTQLREAYYLLIQAMHDLPPDSGRRQGDRGRADRGCPAGARAPGQPPSPCGAAARRACPRDCERGGGGRPWQQVSPPRSPPKESGGGRLRTPRMLLSCSRSLDSLRVGAKPPPLQRWRSDSWIRCGARGEPDEPPPRGGGMDGWSGGSSRAAAPSGLRTRSSEDPRRSSGSRGKEDGQEGLPFLKPPAVTVKKLQKWMYKGRLLSLGMKGRARRTPPEVTRAQATSPNLGAMKMRENQVVSVPPDQRITLTGRIPCNQNVFTNWASVLRVKKKVWFCRQVRAGAKVRVTSVAA